MKKKTNKPILRKGFIFLGLFLLYFLFIYIILNLSFLYNYINYFFGITSNFIVNHIFLIPSSLSFNVFSSTSVITITSLNYPIYINSLCTGILELSLLVSAILATTFISWKKRLTWVFVSLGVVIVFNIIRISFTTFLITKLNLETASFFHGFLFRFFMVLIIIGVYYLFLRNANKR